MNLAQLLNQKVTPLKLWNPPKDDGEVRPSDLQRKHNHAKRIEETYEALDKRMTPLEVSRKLGFTKEVCEKYLLGLYRAERINRSFKQPYTYWKP